MNIEQERELFEEWYIEFLDLYSESLIDITLELMPGSESGLDIYYVKARVQDFWQGWQARAKLQPPMNGE